jgi:RNA polymerase sigma-70 factor, ECF subfamily
MQATETLLESERQARRGFLGENASELDNVISRNLPMFHKQALRYLGNATDAEDAVQDALLSACKHLDQFKKQARMTTWLTAIVINSARMQLRRRRAMYLSLDQPDADGSLAFSEQLPDSKPGPEQACCIFEARDRMLKAAASLSPVLRKAFQLREIDGLSTKEAALALGISEGTVKSQLARARLSMKAGLRASTDKPDR